ncbi:hypothetical protein [Candidatus Palauibacter sp.]|uniref:hypothetical protein n=1 Tax=Candidatus Palauibacter sp. TaxID=3101350 RepID=UPI003B021398
MRNNRFTAICALAAALGSVTACEGWGTGPGGRHAPHSIDDIPPVELWVFGGPLDVALAPYFRDPNGDSLRFSLSYGAHPSDAMEASLSQDFATITPIWSRGTGAVTVTATDPGGLYAQQTFAVRVLHTSAPLTDLNRPRATAKLPPMQLQLGGRATIRLADYFYLPWPTEWEITSSSSSLAASVSEDILTLEGRRVGPARVTVRATNDRSGGGARQQFAAVVVAPGAPPNEWPVLRQCPNPKLIPWQTPVHVDLSAHFSDPDSDRLTFAATSAAPDTVAVSVSGGLLTLEGRSGSWTSVEVMATDPGGLFAVATIPILRTGNAWKGRSPCRI